MDTKILVCALVLAGGCDRAEDKPVEATENETERVEARSAEREREDVAEARAEVAQREPGEPSGSDPRAHTEQRAQRTGHAIRDVEAEPRSEKAETAPLTGMNDPALQGSLKADRGQPEEFRQANENSEEQAEAKAGNRKREIRAGASVREQNSEGRGGWKQPVAVEAGGSAREQNKERAAERRDIAADAREELTKLDDRAAKLEGQLEAADSKVRSEANAALAEVPAQRKAIEADLDALESVRAENLKRARSSLERRLSVLDATLDKAESRL